MPRTGLSHERVSGGWLVGLGGEEAGELPEVVKPATGLLRGVIGDS